MEEIIRTMGVQRVRGPPGQAEGRRMSNAEIDKHVEAAVLMPGETKDDVREAVIRALARYRDVEFAKWLLFAISVAAETHPEELRQALGKVFDTTAIEEMTKRCFMVASDAQRRAEEARQLLLSVERTVEDLERQLDAVNTALESTNKRMAALQANQKKFRDAFVAWKEGAK